MSQENVELAYRAYDTFNRRDLNAHLSLMDDDVEGVPSAARIEGSYHGHDGIRRWWESILDFMPDYQVEVAELRDVEDFTVASVRTRGHGGGSDIPVDDTVWQAARWRGGKCVWWRSFDSRQEALEAANLSE